MASESNVISIAKNLIAISLFIFGMFNVASAQDIITLKNGEEIKAKVSEVEINVIKYKKFDNQTGPVYTLEKADVFMIKYENGSKDVFDFQPVKPADSSWQNETGTQTVSNGDKLTCVKRNVMKDKRKLMPYEVKATMNNNYAALKKYKSGRTFNTLGIIFLAIGGIDACLAISYSAQGYDATGNFMVAGLEIGAGVLFGSISKNKIQSSVYLYNLGLKNPNLSRVNLGVTQNGLGICLNF